MSGATALNNFTRLPTASLEYVTRPLARVVLLYDLRTNDAFGQSLGTNANSLS